MAECLFHPSLGVYAAGNPLGSEGHFTTAPEISQIFGEMIGACLAQAWLDRGAPERFCLVELGPGRGTLMADILRVGARVPGFLNGAEIILIEASPHLRALQRDRLADHRITWHGQATGLPALPAFFVANEFFDALPIHQFQFTKGQWHERLIGLRDGALCFGLSAGPIAAPATGDIRPVEGMIVETCPGAIGHIAAIDQHIGTHGGAALIIDYGDWQSQGDTFQALSQHQRTDPLAAPGTADLTAHVDFEALARAVTRAKYTRLTPQGVFLERLGITQRAQALADRLTGTARAAHISAHRRLTHPDEMGTLFKVMGLYANDTPCPPGLMP